MSTTTLPLATPPDVASLLDDRAPDGPDDWHHLLCNWCQTLRATRGEYVVALCGRTFSADSFMEAGTSDAEAACKPRCETCERLRPRHERVCWAREEPGP